MEKRVQCLERIVREQQHEMERLMGIILPVNPPIMHVPGLHQSNQSAAHRAPLENQNFYFHDESVVGPKTPAKQRKTPLQNDQNWDMQSKGSNTSGNRNKDTRTVAKAFPVGKPKPANNLRVPMKQSRAVNAAKDFIDYIANKEVVVAKNVSATDASSAHNYRAGSRSVPHPVLSYASRSNKKGKRITAPTTDKNAKSSFLIPQRDHTARPVIVLASTSRSAFVSNFDRDQRGYGTQFISNADRPNYDQYVRDRDEFVSNPNPDPLSYDGYENRNGRTGNYGRFSSDFSNIGYASNGAYGDQQGQGFYSTGPATVTASSSSSSGRARYMGAGAEKAPSMHRDDERDSYMSRPQGQRPYMNNPDPEQRTYVSSKFMINTKEKAKASKVTKKVPKKGNDKKKAAAAAAVSVPAAVVRRKEPAPVEDSDSDIVVVMTSSERARARRGLPAADAHEIITLYDSSSSSSDSSSSSSSSSDSSSSSSSNNRSRRKANARSGSKISSSSATDSITVGSKRKEKEKTPGESEMSKKKSAPLPVPIAVSVSGPARTAASTATQGLPKATSSSSSSSYSSSSAIPSLPPPPSSSQSASSSKPTTVKTVPTPTPTPTPIRPTIADRQRVLSPSAATSNSMKASSASSSSSSSLAPPSPPSTYSTSYPSYSSTRPPSQSTIMVAAPASASAVTASSSSSSSFPTSTPTSKSSGVAAAAVVSTKEEDETHNKTAQSDNESENDQDRKKIKKVLSLIQTLTSLSDRQQMAEQLLDKYQTKPAKTKTLIDAGKEIFQEWLAEEVMSFSEETNVLLVEMMLKITDKATWSPEDIARLRVDRTIRQCYKACSALFGTTSGSFSACTALINLTKELWPKYRQMYKVYNSNTSALRNPPNSDPLGDAKAYWQ